MMDTTNKFMVGVLADDIVFMRQIPRKISKDDALNLAAHLVILADDDMGEPGGAFAKILDAMINE